MIFDEKQFRRWWDVFHSDNPLTEIRLIGCGRIESGYFVNCEAAIDALRNVPCQMGVYSPINEITPSCYSRPQRDHFGTGKISTTSGDDITCRRWIFIDFDPKRAGDTNATDAEKEEARAVMLSVGCFLRDQGFSSPVVIDSCNGYHLYYRVNMANTPEVTTLVKDFLRVINMWFGNNICKIDLQVCDPNRTAKVAGTKSNKGFDSPERPQRFSHFVRIPETITTTNISYVVKVASMIPEKEQPNRFNGYSCHFDLEEFISKHGIEVVRRQSFGDGVKLVLKECPFDSNHKAPDSAIFVMNNGAIGFKCLHNSCSSYTWKDVRLHYDPQAYDRRDVAEFEAKRDFFSTAPRPAPVIMEETDDKGKKWMTLSSIEWEDPSKLTFIPTGFTGIDSQIGGLALGDVTIISGLAGVGKTTALDNILLSSIQHGYKCAIWSGELSPQRFASWFNQMAAGRNFVDKGIRNGSEYYYCNEKVSQLIDKWTEDKIFLYNNNYGNKASQILKDVRDCVRERGVQLLVFDNKTVMSLDTYIGDKNEREAGLINELADFAIAAKVHILLVCHPRKEVLSQLLRMESIAGNSDLYNRASNVLLLHKVGLDFERRAKEFYRADTLNEIARYGYTTVVEVAKNRSHGRTDVVAGLYYEQESRRLRNDMAEYIVYDWQEGYLPPQNDPRVQAALEKSLQTFSDDVEEWEKEQDDLPE